MRSVVSIGVAALLAACAAGCGEARPTLAGGKPVSHWTEAIRDPSPTVRKEAAARLGNVGSADPSAAATLAGALKDADAGVRRAAILALVKCGPAARGAVPTLEELRQRDRDPRVRAYAGRALEKLGVGPAGAAQ